MGSLTWFSPLGHPNEKPYKGDDMNSLVLKQKRLKVDVKLWEKNQKLAQGWELIALNLEIKHLFSLFPSSIFPERELQKLVSIKNRKNEILAYEALTWTLKSRALWIEHGDANTKFFHNFSFARCNYNNIWDMQGVDGKNQIFRYVQG